MPVVAEILLDPGAEYDFDTGENTTVLAYSAGTWNGTVADHTILNSDDGVTQGSCTIPSDIFLSYCDIANVAVTGPFKIYADNTCVNGGNNNVNVVFMTNSIAVGGAWKYGTYEYILVGGVWKPIAERNIKIGTLWKSDQPAPSYMTGLVSWWKGQNDATDSVGVNNLAWTGTPAYRAGEVGNGFDFDGSLTSYVTSPDATGCEVSNISLEAWVNRDGPVGLYDNIITKCNYSLEYAGGAGSGIKLWLNLGGTWFSSREAPMTDGVLAHIIATYDGSNIIMYKNGAQVGAPVAATGSIVADLIFHLQMGLNPVIGTRGFNGLIDESSLWNRGLTAAEALAIYNRGSLGK
jgi:hypothetical protein